MERKESQRNSDSEVMKGNGDYLITRGVSACLVKNGLWASKTLRQVALAQGAQCRFPSIVHEELRCLVVNWTRDTGLAEITDVERTAACAWAWRLQVWVSQWGGLAVCSPCRAGADEPWKRLCRSLWVHSNAPGEGGRTRHRHPSTKWIRKAGLEGLRCRDSQASSAWGGAPNLSGASWVSAQAEGSVQGWDHPSTSEAVLVN